MEYINPYTLFNLADSLLPPRPLVISKIKQALQELDGTGKESLTIGKTLVGLKQLETLRSQMENDAEADIHADISNTPGFIQWLDNGANMYALPKNMGPMEKPAYYTVVGPTIADKIGHKLIENLTGDKREQVVDTVTKLQKFAAPLRNMVCQIPIKMLEDRLSAWETEAIANKKPAAFSSIDAFYDLKSISVKLFFQLMPGQFENEARSYSNRLAELGAKLFNLGYLKERDFNQFITYLEQPADTDLYGLQAYVKGPENDAKKDSLGNIILRIFLLIASLLALAITIFR